MPQYDFGTIDPNVVDGTTLASMLNQWRDAMYSMMRGGSRPAYIVAGQMWINDSGGATNWVVNVYLGSAGDIPLWQYNTTTGLVTDVSPLNLIQAASSPELRWNATGNAADAKRWGAIVNAAGALVLSSFTDAGVIQNSFTFNRDGSLANKAWRQIGRVVGAAQTTIDFTAVPADINDLQFSFDALPSINDSDLCIQFFDGGGSIVTTNYLYATQATTSSQSLGSAPIASTATAIGNVSLIILNYSQATNKVNSAAANGIKGTLRVPSIRDTTRIKGGAWDFTYINASGNALFTGTGAGARNATGAITGVRFLWGNAATFAAGGEITAWGSP